MPRPTTIAFYLPQFYPIPENDAWYGEGFTEWHNVVRARPLFPGHNQPHLPADLGYYDLRVEEVREKQALMARRHGIDAFCYYHYWFDGHRPLTRVVDDAIASARPIIPFCLAWANENWSRHWDASTNEVLLSQRYSPADDEAHGRFLLRAMTSPGYLRVAGRAVLFIYRIQALPDPCRTIATWRELWSAGGLDDVHIVKFDSHGDARDPASFGADAAAQFLPHGLPPDLPRIDVRARQGNVVLSYEDVAAAYERMEPPAWRRYECVIPGWDNSPRRGDGASMVIHGSTPERYREWLATVHRRCGPDGMVLVNAWNEWAEGAHLEPDTRFGRAHLEATAAAVGAAPPQRPADVSTRALAAPTEPANRFATLYLDAIEAATRLQRRLSRLEATIDRQVGLGILEARRDAEEARAQAMTLSAEVERLRAELACAGEHVVDGLPTVEVAGRSLPMSDTACVIPWSNLVVSPDGTAGFCCDAPVQLSVDGRPGRVDRDSLDDLWNAREIVDVRARMARGERPDACRVCWEREDAGGMSRRIAMNEVYRRSGCGLDVNTLPLIGAGTGHRLERPPDWYILELGNVCTLRCRSCNPTSSSRIAADPVHSAWNADPIGDERLPVVAPLQLMRGRTSGWFKDVDAVADMIRRSAQDNVVLSLIGGEPFLIPQTWRLLERLVDLGLSERVYVGLLTNGQQRSDRLLELARRFRGVNVSVSIDGCGALFEYLRHGARWDTLVENLRAFRDIPGIGLTATPTLQNVNALDMVPLMRFLDEQEMTLVYNVLTWPRRLQPANLPPSIRRVAAARLRDYLATECTAVNADVVRGYCESLEAAGDDFDEELFDEFMEFTNDLDCGRGESLAEAAPELVAMIAEAGIAWTDRLRHAAVRA